jgi:hypothetical protein
MAGGEPLILTLELVVSTQPITGLVRRPDRSTERFSGWSELFAALQRFTSVDGEQPIEDGSRESRAGRRAW